MAVPRTVRGHEAGSELPPRGRGWLLLIGIWFLAGLAMQWNRVRTAPPDEPVTLVDFAWWVLDWHLYLALVPAIFWTTRRFPITRGRVVRRLAIHAGAAAAIALVSLLLTSTVRWLTGFHLGDGVPSEGGFFAPFHVRNLVFNLCLYATLAAVAHGLRFWRRAKRRELEAVRLERSLAEARLEALQLRLEPHFLFNTLSSVAALIPRDPEGAERVIARLSDLLRFLLQQERAHEVPLSAELVLLEHYLDIERTRFGDRLTVEMEVEPQTRDIAVPSLLLQPLVENALRHGIARVPGPGTVTVEARRASHEGTGDRLVLSVEDSGLGIDGPAESLAEGTGLATTRRRLSELYGESQRLLLAPGERGGLKVTVELPWRTVTPTAARAGRGSLG